MTEDLVVIGGLFVALAVAGWYVAQAISGVAGYAPADDLCRFASDCVASALGQ